MTGLPKALEYKYSSSFLATNKYVAGWLCVPLAVTLVKVNLPAHRPNPVLFVDKIKYLNLQGKEPGSN